MGWPVVVISSGGIPITEVTSGFGTPVDVSTNGFGTAVTLVAAGGLPVTGSGGITPPAFTASLQFNDARNSQYIGQVV